MLDDFTEILKAIHVLAAVIWVGGAAASQFYAIRIQKANDPARLAGFGKDAEWVGMHIFFPASIVVLALGIWITIRVDYYAFGDAWILIGLGGILFSALVGSLFLGPESGRIAKLLEAEGPESPAFQQRMSRLYLVSRIELAVLIIVVLDMVVRPGSPV